MNTNHHPPRYDTRRLVREGALAFFTQRGICRGYGRSRRKPLLSPLCAARFVSIPVCSLDPAGHGVVYEVGFCVVPQSSDSVPSARDSEYGVAALEAHEAHEVDMASHILKVVLTFPCKIRRTTPGPSVADSARKTLGAFRHSEQA
ncbi:hypothetical protein B0H14DRAFT_2626228 [Mycena olivaceomarginata]|nr:hypothetical protein B0H14DRAFT_2626228 [Mycena olivaceomarginata]